MTVQTFRELLSKRPFMPFRLVMSSGEKFDIRKPEAAFLTQASIQVGIDFGDDGIPAGFRICSLSEVKEIKQLKLKKERS
jgi:hypothetical protein